MLVLSGKEARHNEVPVGEIVCLWNDSGLLHKVSGLRKFGKRICKTRAELEKYIGYLLLKVVNEAEF